MVQVHVNAMENEAATGRYPVAHSQIPLADMVAAYQRLNPSYPNPPLAAAPYQPGDLWDTTRTQQLIGGHYRSIDETVRDMSESFKKFNVV